MEKVKTKYGEVSYLQNDIYIANSLKNGILFEQALVEKLLTPFIRKSTVILDIGAHIGCHSLIYTTINPTAQIHAFELQSAIYSLLKINIETNKLNNIKYYNCAIGNLIKMIQVNEKISDGPNANTIFDYDGEKDFNYGGVSVGIGTEEKLMITIDSLDLDGCDFIKIDTEGFEYFCLLGAINTIKTYKPIIFFEHNHKVLTDEMLEIAEVVKTDHMTPMDLLSSIGYKTFITMPESNILAAHTKVSSYDELTAIYDSNQP